MRSGGVLVVRFITERVTPPSLSHSYVAKKRPPLTGCVARGGHGSRGTGLNHFRSFIQETNGALCDTLDKPCGRLWRGEGLNLRPPGHNPDDLPTDLPRSKCSQFWWRADIHGICPDTVSADPPMLRHAGLEPATQEFRSCAFTN